MFRFTLLLALAASCAGYSQLDCPDLYDVLIYDLCYRVYTIPLNFTEAKETCNKHGRQLAILHNGWQDSYLTATVNTQTGINNGAYWIGLERASNTSHFYWDDGSKMWWNLWNLGYPNQYNQVGVSTFNGYWMTLDESEKHVFVCSYDPKSQKTTTATEKLTTAEGKIIAQEITTTQATTITTEAKTTEETTTPDIVTVPEEIVTPKYIYPPSRRVPRRTTEHHRRQNHPTARPHHNK